MARNAVADHDPPSTMFFLFFSYRTRVKVLGETAERQCPRCHNDVRPIHVRTYRVLSLFFVPLARWHQRELDTCPICGHAEPDTAGDAIHATAIPTHA